MDGKLHSVVFLLGPALSALLLLAGLRYSSLSRKLEPERIARFLDRTASFMLPLIVLSAVHRTDISTSLWASFVVGFFLPISVYVVVLAVARLPFFASLFANDGRTNHLLLSSFGGGNRGNLLILTAFASPTSIGPDIIKQFVVLDLGNLICLLSLGFWMVDALSSERSKIQIRLILESLYRNPGTYAVILMFLHLPTFQGTFLERSVSSFARLLEGSASFLNPLFSFCIFSSIFIRIGRLSSVLVDARDVILCFLLSRGSASFAILTLLGVLGLPIDLLIATAILALMPPSSFLWTRILQRDQGMPDWSKRKVIYLVPNFFYFAMLAAAFVWGLL